MSDNVSDRPPNRSKFSLFDEVGDMADPRSVNHRIRREFLRRMAMTTVAIPAIGGVSLAGEKKRKAKEKETDSASSSASVGGAKTSATAKKNPGTSSPRTAHQTTNQSIGQGHEDAAYGSSDADVTDAKENPGPPLRELYNKSTLEAFEQIQADENAHVAFLVNALGTSARPTPIFQGLEQAKVHEFAVMARTFENTGAGAYLGAVPLLASTQLGIQYLPAAGSLALIEGRHSGWLNTLLDLNLVENVLGNISSFEVPLTPQQVVNLVSPFIVDLNGGPPLIPAGGLSNAIDILNFALTLEYLESQFYNINLPNLRQVLAR